MRNALALIASTGSTALLGFLFWGVAAHLYSPSQVGRASAVVSAMTLLAALAQLNLPRLYPRFLPEAGNRARRFILLGYLACAAVGLALAIGYVGVGLANSVISSSIEKVVFIFAVPLWVIFTIQDSVLTGFRAAVWVPVENLAFGFGKLLLIFPLVGYGAAGLFFGWTLPVVLTVTAVNLYVFGHLVPRHRAASAGVSQLPSRRLVWSLVATGALAGQVTTISRSLIPLLVVERLGPRQGAYFYIPWLVATTLPGMLWSISTSLVVEAGFEPQRARELFRRSAKLAVGIVAPSTLGLILIGPLVMRALGYDYARSGETLLRLVALASMTYVLPLLYETLVWLEGDRLWRFALVEGGNSAMLIVGSVTLIPRWGIDGPGAAMLIAGCITAVCVTIPALAGLRSLNSRART